MVNKASDFQSTINWYNANAEQYAQNIEKASNPDLIERFSKKVKVGGRVLDAGCAAGRDSRLLKKQGLEPVGVDLSPSLIKVAKRMSPDIEFLQGNFLHLLYENDSFDGIWAHASLLHFETIKEVKEALTEFYRVLKTGGIIHIYLKQQLGDEKTSVVTDKLSNHQKRFFQWFTKDEVKVLLEEANFEIIDLQDNYVDKAERDEVRWIVALAKK